METKEHSELAQLARLEAEKLIKEVLTLKMRFNLTAGNHNLVMINSEQDISRIQVRLANDDVTVSIGVDNDERKITVKATFNQENKRYLNSFRVNEIDYNKVSDQGMLQALNKSAKIVVDQSMRLGR